MPDGTPRQGQGHKPQEQHGQHRPCTGGSKIIHKLGEICVICLSSKKKSEKNKTTKEKSFPYCTVNLFQSSQTRVFKHTPSKHDTNVKIKIFLISPVAFIKISLFWDRAERIT